MGQKSNTLTLQKSKFNINLLKLNPKNFAYSFEFLKFLKKLFEIKKIFLTTSILNFYGNQSFLTLYLFFRTVKINAYKRKTIRLSIKNSNFDIKNKIFSKLWRKNLNFLKNNIVTIKYINLNKKITNDSLFLFLYKKFKYIHLMLFPRRFSFFIDFLKITILFVYNKINLNFYLYTLGQIFKILQKKRHNFFISFLEQFFRFIIYNLLTYVDKSQIKGVKFMISGRIQAKPRAKFQYFQLGVIPIQSVNKKIDFSKTHVYTIYGVFGFKLWVYRY